MHPAIARRFGIARAIAALFLLVAVIGFVPAVVGVGYMFMGIFFGMFLLLPIPVLGFMQIPFFARRSSGERDPSDSGVWVLVAAYNGALALIAFCIASPSSDLDYVIPWLAFLTVVALVAAACDARWRPALRAKSG